MGLSAAPWLYPMSVTSVWAGTNGRRRFCTLGQRWNTPACWPCIRCRRVRRWRGYRAGFVAGDPVVVAELLAVRKHAGMMVPGPVQAAMVAALDDDAHEAEQRQRYARRREVLLAAVRSAGFTIEHSQAGLYVGHPRPTVP